MLRRVPHTAHRVCRAYEHFPDGFELHLLPGERGRERVRERERARETERDREVKRFCLCFERVLLETRQWVASFTVMSLSPDLVDYM